MNARFASALRYLSFADSPTKWRVSFDRCPTCGPSVFASLRASAFMTRCMRCRANAVTLAPIPVIRQTFQDLGKVAAYELSTFGVMLDWMRRNLRSVQTSEFFPGRASGDVVGGILCQDVQALSFPDETFDLVTSNSVFEHVDDDLLGFAEVRRVLKPGGALVMTVPLYDTPATRRISRYVNGELQWLDTPEYHDSRMGGPRSAPVVWYHSKRDIVARVLSCGFERAELCGVRIAGHTEYVLRAHR